MVQEEFKFMSCMKQLFTVYVYFLDIVETIRLWEGVIDADVEITYVNTQQSSHGGAK